MNKKELQQRYEKVLCEELTNGDVRLDWDEWGNLWFYNLHQIEKEAEANGIRLDFQQAFQKGFDVRLEKGDVIDSEKIYEEQNAVSAILFRAEERGITLKFKQESFQKGFDSCIERGILIRAKVLQNLATTKKIKIEFKEVMFRKGWAYLTWKGLLKKANELVRFASQLGVKIDKAIAGEEGKMYKFYDEQVYEDWFKEKEAKLGEPLSSGLKNYIAKSFESEPSDPIYSWEVVSPDIAVIWHQQTKWAFDYCTYGRDTAVIYYHGKIIMIAGCADGIWCKDKGSIRVYYNENAIVEMTVNNLNKRELIVELKFRDSHLEKHSFDKIKGVLLH